MKAHATRFVAATEPACGPVPPTSAWTVADPSIDGWRVTRSRSDFEHGTDPAFLPVQLRLLGRALANAAPLQSELIMPEVSRFFGIIIRFYYNDHEPAHFHAAYGEYEALVEIHTLAVLRGELPRRALALVLEWAAIHRAELWTNWEAARRGAAPLPIAPLD